MAVQRSPSGHGRGGDRPSEEEPHESHKERLLFVANRLSVAALAALGLSMTLAVYLIADVVFRAPVAIAVSATAGALFGLFWFALPLRGRGARQDQTGG